VTKTDNFIAIVTVQTVFTTYPQVTPMIFEKGVHYIARKAILGCNMTEIGFAADGFGGYSDEE
jgi:hypothetical protein